MAWVWDNSRAEATELLVLLAMADFAGDNGWCFPRQETLAKRCRVAVRTVQRAIDQLEELGEIEVQRRARINWYKVIGDKMTSDDMGVAYQTRQSDVSDTTPVSPHTRHSYVASKEPSVNHQLTNTRDASQRKPKHPDDRPWVPPTNFVENLDTLPERHVDPAPSSFAAATLARLRQRNVDG